VKETDVTLPTKGSKVSCNLKMAAVLAPSAPPAGPVHSKLTEIDEMSGHDSVTPKRIIRKVGECPVQEVCVFTDRAEITRAVLVEAQSSGQYDVVIEGITKLAVADSFRCVRARTTA
jgi:hypothetical protein